MKEENHMIWRGFYRIRPPTTTTEGWIELPEQYPAGGDEPLDDALDVIPRFLKRDHNRIKKLLQEDDTTRPHMIDVRLFGDDGRATTTSVRARINEVVEFSYA